MIIIQQYQHHYRVILDENKWIRSNSVRALTNESETSNLVARSPNHDPSVIKRIIPHPENKDKNQLKNSEVQISDF